MAVLKINEANFNEQILEKDVALVDFYADWCGPCKMVAPVVEEIAKENPHITVGKINVDAEPELAQEFGIASIPTLVVIKNGEVTDTMVGFRPKEQILQMLNL